MNPIHTRRRLAKNNSIPPRREAKPQYYCMVSIKINEKSLEHGSFNLVYYLIFMF